MPLIVAGPTCVVNGPEEDVERYSSYPAPGAIEAFVPLTTTSTLARNGSETVTVTLTGEYASAGDGVVTRLEIGGAVVSWMANVPWAERFQFPLGSTASTVNR